MARSDAGGTVTVNNADHFQRRENTRSPHILFAAAAERIIEDSQGGFSVHYRMYHKLAHARLKTASEGLVDNLGLRCSA